MTVREAEAAIAKAEQRIAEAEAARDEAYDQLDVALAARGWKRMYGAFSARLYTTPLAGGNAIPLADVLEHERKLAA